jgi:hypothetical protein
MATKEDIVDFANRGMDQMFPARRIARMAGLTSATQALNKAKQGATEEEFNNAIGKAEKTRAAYRGDVAEHLKNSIFKKFTPASIDDFSSRPKNNKEFDSEGMDKEYKKGGKVSASSRADGVAQRGKTKGRMC